MFEVQILCDTLGQTVSLLMYLRTRRNLVWFCGHGSIAGGLWRHRTRERTPGLRCQWGRGSAAEQRCGAGGGRGGRGDGGGGVVSCGWEEGRRDRGGGGRGACGRRRRQVREVLTGGGAAAPPSFLISWSYLPSFFTEERGGVIDVAVLVPECGLEEHTHRWCHCRNRSVSGLLLNQRVFFFTDVLY